MDRFDVAAGLGLASLVAGLAFIFWPLALVAVGAAGLAVGLLETE